MPTNLGRWWLSMLHIDLRHGQAVKRRNAPVWITGASGRRYQEATLTVEGLNWVRIVTLAGGRWTANYYITPATGSSDQLEKVLEWEPCPNKGWAPRPPVEQPRRTGKKGCDIQKSGGQYVAVFKLTSHSIIPFVTLSNPSK